MCSAAKVNRYKPEGRPRQFLLQLVSDLTSNFAILTVFYYFKPKTKTTVIIESDRLELKKNLFFAVRHGVLIGSAAWRQFLDCNQTEESFMHINRVTIGVIIDCTVFIIIIIRVVIIQNTQAVVNTNKHTHRHRTAAILSMIVIPDHGLVFAL